VRGDNKTSAPEGAFELWEAFEGAEKRHEKFVEREIEEIKRLRSQALGENPTPEQEAAMAVLIGHVMRLGGETLDTHAARGRHKQRQTSKGRKVNHKVQRQAKERRDHIIDAKITANPVMTAKALVRALEPELKQEGLEPASADYIGKRRKQLVCQTN
jgi:hypothetical protein